MEKKHNGTVLQETNDTRRVGAPAGDAPIKKKNEEKSPGSGRRADGGSATPPDRLIYQWKAEAPTLRERKGPDRARDARKKRVCGTESRSQAGYR